MRISVRDVLKCLSEMTIGGGQRGVRISERKFRDIRQGFSATCRVPVT